MDWIRTQNHWHSADRTAEPMKILLDYGTAAKPAVTELRKIAASPGPDQQTRMRKFFPKQADTIRNTILESIPALEAL